MSSLLVKYMKRDQWLNDVSNPAKFEIMKSAFHFISGTRKSKVVVTKWVLKFFTQREEDDNILFKLIRNNKNPVLKFISDTAEAIINGLKEKQKQIYRLIFVLLSTITDEVKSKDTEGKSYNPANVYKRLLKRLSFSLPTDDIYLRRAIANIDNISSSDEGFHQILESFVQIWTSDIATADTENAVVVADIAPTAATENAVTSSTDGVVVADITTAATENAVVEINTIPLRGRDENKTKKKKRKIFW